MKQKVAQRWSRRWGSSGEKGDTKVEVALTLKRSRRWQSSRARGGTYVDQEVALMWSKDCHS